MVDDWEGCKAFIQEVGYPVIVKLDTGVGASNTEKLTCDEELAAFFVAKLRGAPSDLAYARPPPLTGEAIKRGCLAKKSFRQFVQRESKTVIPSQ